MGNFQLWIVVLLYLVVSVVAGVISERREKQKSMSGYFHSSLSPMVMAFTLVGGLVSYGGPTCQDQKEKKIR